MRTHWDSKSVYPAFTAAAIPESQSARKPKGPTPFIKRELSPSLSPSCSINIALFEFAGSQVLTQPCTRFAAVAAAFWQALSVENPTVDRAPSPSLSLSGAPTRYE